MGFQLRLGKPVARELSHLVANEFEKAIDELGRWQGADRAEAVHEARKCVKKVRAVLHLLKQNLGHDYRVLDGKLRRVAHRLSSLRDVDVSPEIMNALRDHAPRIVTRSMSRAVQRGLLARTRGTVASIPIGCCSASLSRSSDRGRGCDGEFAAWHKRARYRRYQAGLSTRAKGDGLRPHAS
jgi:hypothetical protein